MNYMCELPICDGCPATSPARGGSFLMSRCVLRKTPGLTMILWTLALTQVCAAKKTPPPDRTVTVKLPAPPKLKQIQGDDRVLHALDRLTFGPRPGEIDQVKAMGLDVWIVQQ